MLWRLGQQPDTWGRLLVFETRSGKRLYDHRIGYELPQIDSLWFDGGTRCLQWWPERRGWLLFGRQGRLSGHLAGRFHLCANCAQLGVRCAKESPDLAFEHTRANDLPDARMRR